MSSKQRIAIGYPHNGSVRECFMASLMQFREFDIQHDGILGAVIREQGLYIAGLRNKIVSQFLTTPFDWLMMIDTDQQFAPHQPYHLLQSVVEAGAEVMSALYFGVLAGHVAPMWWIKNRKGDYTTCPDITGGVQEIEAFGCGMFIVHRDVLEHMATLYPNDPWKWFGHDLTYFNGHMDRFGEDLCFCHRLSEMDVKMYGDSRIVIGHDKSQVIDLDMVLKLAPQRKEGEPIVERVLERVLETRV